MIETSPLFPTSFITFYSFKGGVGRSMAMINVAGILAGRGFRVMALDMDLEAPGISYLMRAEAKAPDDGGPGLVDLLTDACERGEEADLFALDPVAVVEKYSYPYTVPDGIRESEEGLLRIMPAGRMDGDYQQRLDALNLGQLYRDGRGQPLIGVFKDVIKESALFDFVFVDSRTGFSDEAGICTRDLADCLIVVMGLNRQNVEGTSEFLRALKGAGINKPLRIVLSPVPTGEDELREERERVAAERLSQAYGQKLDLTLKIPYHPRLALTEEPHIFRRRRGYLHEAYMRLYEAVLEMCGPLVEYLIRNLESAVTEQRLDDVVAALKKLQILDAGSVLELAANQLSEVALQENAGELRACIAELLPGSSPVMARLAETLHQARILDAGLFYSRLLEGNPKDAFHIQRRADFLMHVAKDFEGAATQYKRAFQLDSTNVQVVSGYAKCLFVLNRTAEGKAILVKLKELDPKDATELEFLFDHLLRLYLDGADGLVKAIKSILSTGIRTIDLPYEEILRQATEAGHPAPAFLAALAKVIVGDASLETLDAFPEWQSV